jgi:hypothetical protein
MKWLSFAISLGGMLLALWTWWYSGNIPDMKLATAYVCGKYDQLRSSQGLPPADGCAEVRAIYERETRSHVQEASQLLDP